MSASWKAGFGKHEITAWEPEMAMMGWGRMDNRITGVQTPLYARAVALQRGDDLIVYGCVELMAISLAIRTAVLERLDEFELGIDEHNLMLTATHTHSGPSGYSHYFFMNLNGPGFSPTVFDAAVEGTVSAIVDAVERLEPAALRFGAGDVPLTDAVAFNRSWFAYSRNEDVEPVSKDRRDEAVDRRMTILAADALDGRKLGSVVWFPVHCTSVHAENDRLHSDNKGIAAQSLEEHHGSGYVAVCAQEASGDVTPNFRYASKRRKVIGKFDDDYRSAEFNGELQARHAKRIDAEMDVLLEEGPVQGATHYVDFSTIHVDEAHSGKPDRRTTVATLGITMAEGTDEGPGPLLRARPLTRGLAKLKGRRDPDDPKVPMLDVGRGLDARFLGFSVRPMRIPPVDDTIRYVRSVLARGEMENHPWIPQVVPLQLMQVGPLLIVGIPFEATTVAGRRIRAHVRQRFGVEHVIISSYANAYAGYLTTNEEYLVQHYEAGYTLFGPHQLAATLTMLDWMCDRWPGRMPLGQAPPRFGEQALGSRLFTPWTVPRARRPW